jgi:ABC-type transport system involved in multi-copper enzyme maturation permease subunit
VRAETCTCEAGVCAVSVVVYSHRLIRYGDIVMGKFAFGLLVSVILLVIAVVLTMLIVRGKFGIP